MALVANLLFCEQLAAPKSKYIEHILVATHTGEAGVAEIFRTLHLRLRDSTWTVVFKALIVTHFMVREGRIDATLQFLAENPKMLAISGYSEGQYEESLLFVGRCLWLGDIVISVLTVIYSADTGL